MTLTTSTHHDVAQDTDRKKKKRGAVIKLALAGAAIIGIGAAATSAAWTDDAWFSASASSATVELQGSLDGVTWTDADTAVAGLTIPTSTFGNLLPGQTKTVTLNLKNTGSTSVSVASTVALSGAVFTGTGPATVAVAAVPTIAANGTTTVVVTLTTPADWADTYRGATGSVTVRFTGTAL